MPSEQEFDFEAAEQPVELVTFQMLSTNMGALAQAATKMGWSRTDALNNAAALLGIVCHPTFEGRVVVLSRNPDGAPPFRIGIIKKEFTAEYIINRFGE